MIKFKKLKDIDFNGMESLLIEQNNKNDKNTWSAIIGSLYEKFDEYLVIADVRHLYPVSNESFFPTDKNRSVYIEDIKNKIYLFSIINKDEIVRLTKMYCEDYSLSYLFFRKTENFGSDYYLKYFNFAFTSEEIFRENIVEMDLYVAFGAIAEYMGLTYKQDLFESMINPVLLSIKNDR